MMLLSCLWHLWHDVAQRVPQKKPWFYWVRGALWHCGTHLHKFPL